MDGIEKLRRRLDRFFHVLGERARDPRVLYAVVVLGLILSAQSFAHGDFVKFDSRMMDLRAFWCAGNVVNAHGNPYLTEPLRSCEHAIPETLLRRWPNAVIPYVHPGYDAAASQALARFPFSTAAALFMVLAFASLVCSIWLLTRTLELRWPLVTASLLLPIGLSTFLYGQVAAFELLFVAASAAALAARRDRLAGALASLTLFEPHIGLFIVLATAVAVRGARLTVALGTALLGLLAIVTTGPGPQLMWLAGLSRQATAEARYEGQYSLTYVLTGLGLPTPAALLLGAASTLVLLVVAVALARAFARRGVRAGVVLVPTALAVAGGTFIHLTQIALAVPAALLLYRVATTPLRRALAALGVVLLSVPWSYPAFDKHMLGFGLVTLAVLVWHVSGRSMRTTLLAVVGCWIVFAAMENNPPRAEAAPVVHRAPASAPATSSWAELVSAFHGYDAQRVAVKVPTWLGLLLLAGSASFAARAPAGRGQVPQ
jgi:Glycosyltransferase family 87